MEDYLMISGAELVAIFSLWPRLAGRSTGWHNKALLDDNPHLRICLRARQWITPVIFLICAVAGTLVAADYATALSEVLFLNLVLVLSALLLGYVISEFVVDRYRGGRVHRRRLTSAA